MNRAEAVARLRDHADAIKAMGATSLYLFGSAAEDTAGASSDLDLFIDYDVTGRFIFGKRLGDRCRFDDP
jgi:predicted nucleotidyltransferase